MRFNNCVNVSMVSNLINYPLILVNLKSYSETMGAKAEELAEKLDTKKIIIKGAGHLNSEAGFGRFDLLLEKIKKEL